MNDIIISMESRDPHEKEFQQSVREVLKSIEPLMAREPRYQRTSILERIIEPERIVTFRVPWTNDLGEAKVNRGFRIEINSALGPYKGGLRFHPSVNQSIMKFLALEQVFGNALTTMPLGGAAGGSDFDPKGKSDNEVMRFCQSFMAELFRHIGADTDIPAGDIGVGAREIGYLFGMYRKLQNEFSGVMTGKGLGWGGSRIRQAAAGYGCVYFAAEMLATWNETLEGKTCLVSGSGKVAQSITEKLIDLNARVLTMSDSSGYIYDEAGIGRDKLEYIKLLKNIQRGRIQAYAEKFPTAVYVQTDQYANGRSLWGHRADCAFPAAYENEIDEKDAYQLINNRIKVVCECANMPCTAEAMALLRAKKGVLYAPSKAANAGGMTVAGLEMAQNNMRLSWTSEEVDQRLRIIINNIHQRCLDAAAQYNAAGNYADGANILAFTRVADAMLDQGMV